MNDKFSEGHTLKFMGYTCGDVDHATECAADEIISRKDSFIEEVNGIMLGILSDLRDEIPEEFSDLITNFEDSFVENIENEAYNFDSDIIDACGGANEYIKYNVTYKWREQSIEMMNYAYGIGMELFEEVQYKRQWQKDMGIKNPDMVFSENFNVYPDGSVLLF